MGRTILFPINLFVTFLHELGHGLGALITGGSIVGIQINQDGSGFARTIGGNRSITLMGGYLGSAILGNILFFIGVRSKILVKPILSILAVSMLATAVLWFNSVFTSVILFIFAACILFVTFRTEIGRYLLIFFGLASILFIIQDFNVGPTSDLAAYAKEMIFLPASVWMYIWLAIVVVLFLFNVRLIWNSTPEDYDNYA